MSISMAFGLGTRSACARAASIWSAYILLGGEGAAATRVGAGAGESASSGIGGKGAGIGVRLANCTRNGLPSAMAPLQYTWEAVSPEPVLWRHTR